MTAKAAFPSTIPGPFRASSLPVSLPADAGPAPGGNPLVNAVRTMAFLLPLVAAAGCLDFRALQFEADSGSVFATVSVHRWFASSSGTLRSNDDGVTWTRIYPAGDFRQVEFVCRCKSALLAELDDQSWYRSTDHGLSWEPVSTLHAHRTSGPTGGGQSDRIFLGTDDGVMHSTDGGVSWARGDTVGLRHRHIRSIAATPSAVVVVGQTFVHHWYDDRGPTLGGWGCFLSSDDGRSWKQMTGTWPSFDTSKYYRGPMCLATGTALFLFDGLFDGALYRSTDDGGRWRKLEDYRVFHLEEYDSSLLAFAETDSGDVVITSPDAGETWTACGAAPPGGSFHGSGYRFIWVGERSIFFYRYFDEGMGEVGDDAVFRSRSRSRPTTADGAPDT